MDKVDATDKVRDAGLYERFHITRWDGGFDTCIFVSAKYTTATNSVLDRKTVLHALKRVVLAHPALCVQVLGDEAEGPYFSRLPSVDLEAILHYHPHEGKTLQQVLTTELNVSFSRALAIPLWRVVVHDDNTVIFACHHVIADGGSGHAFHHAFLTALNAPIQSEKAGEGFVVDVPAELSLAPAIEQCTDITVTWKTFFRMLYGTFAPDSWKPEYTAWTGNPVIPEANAQAEVRIRTIGAEDASRLVELCHRNGSTLTTFLHALSICVLSHLVRTYEDGKFDDGQAYHTFSTSVPVSLLPFTGVSALSMRDHASHHHSFVPILRDSQNTSTFPWKMAAEYRTALKSGFAESRQAIGMIKYLYSLGISKKFFAGQLGKKRADTLELSNIGVVPEAKVAQPEGSTWKIEDVFFGQNNGVCGAAIKMNVAGSPSGMVSITYTWGVGAVETEFAEAFVEELHLRMKTIISKPVEPAGM